MTKGNGSTYVKCRVEPGMFKDEWLVHIDALHPKDRQPAKVQLFVDAREVWHVQGTPKRNAPAQAWLHVTLAAQRGEFASVVLPQPAMPFGENIVVLRELVKEVPAS